MPDDNDELVLQAPTARSKRKGRPTPDERLRSKSVAERLLGRFEAAFAARWGFPYALTALVRDRTLLKNLSEQWGEAATAETIDLFFASTDPQVTKCRFYNVPDFSYWAPKLRMAARGGDLHERTSANVHEISKAMGLGTPTKGSSR